MVIFNKKDEIEKVFAREILSSKGEPSIEVDVFTQKGVFRASAPSGVSTGKTEAVELRDGEVRYGGKGVLKAISNINDVIAPMLFGKNPCLQTEIDALLIKLDGTEQKSNLGANAVVALSEAVCKAGAASKNIPLYEHISALFGKSSFPLPRPQILIIEGGRHGNFATDIQEFMIAPKEERFPSFSEMLRAGSEIFHQLERMLTAIGYSVGVGYEGAFCPREIKSNKEALDLVLEAVREAGFLPGEDVDLAIDAAASEFFKDGYYILKSEGGAALEPKAWTERLIEWASSYPLFSIEDGNDQEDWNEWVYLTQEIGGKTQIVGDDLLTTNVPRIQMAAEKKAVNAVLIKPNQIGTVTETLDAIRFSHSARFKTIISHRGGETNDDFIADLAVGTGASQCKFGAPNRGERIAKYNRLLLIEEELRR